MSMLSIECQNLNWTMQLQVKQAVQVDFWLKNMHGAIAVKETVQVDFLLKNFNMVLAVKDAVFVTWRRAVAISAKA